jgi:hypothetical protein
MSVSADDDASVYSASVASGSAEIQPGLVNVVVVSTMSECVRFIPPADPAQQTDRTFSAIDELRDYWKVKGIMLQKGHEDHTSDEKLQQVVNYFSR